LRRRHLGRCRQVISQWRIEELFRRVFRDLFGVFLIDRLTGIARVSVLRLKGRGREDGKQQAGDKHTDDPFETHVDSLKSDGSAKPIRRTLNDSREKKMLLS
jgi:hypothetical protein